MARRRKIRTPLAQRWNRFRYGALPILGFLGAGAAMIWLWDTHISRPGTLGEVEVVRIDVSSPVDGILRPLPGVEWDLFDPVTQGDLIALLDDRPIQAAVGVVRAELDEIRKRLEAEKARQHWDENAAKRDADQERTRLAWKIASLRVDLLDREAQIEIADIQVRQHDAWLESLRAGLLARTVTDIELREERLHREETAKTRDNAVRLRDETAAQLAAAEKRLSEFTDPPPRDVERWLSPVLAAVATKQAEIRRLQAEADMLQVRSPINGRVASIYCRAGQAVKAGDPIVTIAGTQGRYIVTYLRQDRGLVPIVGMEVLVRNRVPGSRPHKAFVDRIGPQYEPLPQHHLADPTKPEWGLPVRISYPTDLTARPGELLDITFVNTKRS